MRIHKKRLVELLAAVLAGAALWSACSDNSEIFCADPAVDPTLENIWPNEDGTYWTYKVTVRLWKDLEGAAPIDSLYETAEEVPPLPSLDEIEYLLKDHDVGDDIETEFGTYRLEFAGDTTSSQGVTGQNLRELLSFGGSRGAPARPRVPRDPLLARVYLARPDLRTGIERQLGADRSFALVPAAGESPLGSGCFGYPCPMLIHGGVWRKTDEWIVAYADLDTLPAWRFLEADLSVGHEFTHQLIPLLADNMFLHCRVIGDRRVKTEICAFKRALDCIYLVDYGVTRMQGPEPEAQGYYRVFDYGRVLYVATVGPVYVYERMLVCTGDPPGTGVGEKITSLKTKGRETF